MLSSRMDLSETVRQSTRGVQMQERHTTYAGPRRVSWVSLAVVSTGTTQARTDPGEGTHSMVKVNVNNNQ